MNHDRLRNAVKHLLLLTSTSRFTVSFLQVIASGIVVAVLAFLLFVILAVTFSFLAVWLMILIYGRQQVQDAPAHGGAILFLTLPLAAMAALLAAGVVWAIWMERLPLPSRR